MKTEHGFKVEAVRRIPGGTGTMLLWSVEPAIRYQDWDGTKKKTCETHFVITSAADVIYSGPETYIFPANSLGEVTDWGELPGSLRGSLNHETAIKGINHEDH